METARNDRLVRDIAMLRESMLRVHYYEEAHWLAAAVSFPHLCASPLGQDALRRSATIAWQFGFPSVSQWITREILAAAAAPKRAADTRAVRLPPLPELA